MIAPDRTLSEAHRHYRGYEAWKGWTKPFTYTDEEAEYFSGEMRGVTLAGKSLLEVGFGPGNFLAWARAAGANVAGTEINPVMLETARQNKVEVVEGDLTTAAAKNSARFDVVVALDVFEHLTLDEIDAALYAIDAMLRPGGHLILRFPNGQSPFGLLPQNGDITHRTALSKDKIEQLCRNTSLQALCYRGSYRICGPIGLKRAGRKLRNMARDTVGVVLNWIYACDIPWDAVVVLLLRKQK
jgi:2-polyprenyl-3-methyl-5-hydroxy-6-metoxy-1,4-benzoquinol methylase